MNTPHRPPAAFAAPARLNPTPHTRTLKRRASRRARARAPPRTPAPRAVIEPLNKLAIRFDAQRPAAAGSFGEVFFGTLAPTNEPVVLKRPRPTSTARSLFRVERRINHKLDSADPAHWPKFLGDHVRGSEPFLVWRRVGDGCTLHDYLFARPPAALSAALRLGVPSAARLNVPLFRSVVRALLLALRDVHARGVVHRDVKPANVLVAPADPAPLRLIDFGSSADVSAPFWTRGLNTLDPLFAAPEQRLSLVAPDKFDVFSVAMIGVAVLVPSFASEARLREFRRRLERLDFDLRRYCHEVRQLGGSDDLGPLFDARDDQAKETFALLAGMLKKNPLARKSVKAALFDLGVE